MKKYDELIQAVKDGKFRKQQFVAGITRTMIDDKFENVELATKELFATVSTDGVVDEETKGFVIECAFEALAEKLVADGKFRVEEKKIESFDNLFGFLKDAINL